MVGIELIKLLGTSQNLPFHTSDLFNNIEVQEIIDSVGSLKLEYDAGNGDHSMTKGFHREGTSFNIDNLSTNITKKLFEEIHRANFQYQFDLTHLLQVLYFEYYPSGKGLVWHTDIGDKSPYYFRKLSFSLGLNDFKEYEGGEISFFIDENYIPKIKLNKGDLLAFPSFIPHQVHPVTKGIRKNLIGFLGGKPFK